MINNGLRIFIIAIITGFIALAVWLFAKDSMPKSDDVTIRVLESTAPTQWELVKKITGRDILNEEGVKLQFINSFSSSGGTVSLQAILANNIETARSAWPAWINIIAHGGKLKALLSASVSTKENSVNKTGLLVLEGSNIRTIKDLPGKRIAVNVLGAEADYVIRQYLKKNGLSISQVELVVVPGPQQEQMLRTKQVDAVSFSEMYADMAFENGGLREIPGTTNFETKGEVVSSAIGFRSDFIEKHPDVVRRYIRAYDITRRILYDEFQKNPDRIRKAYADISVEKGSNPRLAKYYRPTFLTPGVPFIGDKDIQWWIDRFVEDGLLKPGQIKPSDIYTNEFNPLYKK